MAPAIPLHFDNMTNESTDTAIQENGTQEIIASYNKAKRRKIVGLMLYILVLIVAAGIGMGIGSYDISFVRVYEVILMHLMDLGGDYTSLDMKLVWLEKMINFG